MKKQSNNILYEIKLNFLNKSIFIVFFLSIAFLILNFHNSIEEYKASVNIYHDTFESAVEAGEDVNELLNQDYQIIEEQSNSGGITQYIDNTLKYDYDTMYQNYSAIYWKNCVFTILKKSTLVFLGLLFSLYMVVISTYEFSTNTLKLHMLGCSLKKLIISKLQAGLIIISGIFFSSTFISWIISSIWSIIYLKNVNNNLSPKIYSPQQQFKSILITYIILLLFGLISFATGILVHNMATTVGIILLTHLLIPSLGKYDYKNLILTLYNQAYPLDISIKANYLSGLDPINAFFILLIYSILIFILAYIRFFKQWKNGHNW